MGNFDMNSVFNENMKFSTYELAKELSNESNGKNEMADEIYKKLTNSHGSGLLDKLIKHFDFDMERIAGDSKRETFDILRILKQLYYIEKAGKKGKKIRIIDILAKPRLANIPFVDSRSGIYNDVFRKLYDQIKERRKSSIASMRLRKFRR